MHMKATAVPLVVSSLIWKVCERGVVQLISLVVQIVMARILAPDVFGSISVLLVFINLSNVFINKGFASSLVRKEDLSEEDINTALISSQLITVACIVILWLIAPYVEVFYNIPSLTKYLRVLSLMLIFGSFFSIENAILVRQMKFKQIFQRGLIATLISGGLGISAAILGLGVWALIIQNISHHILLCVVTFIGCKWRPKLLFSKSSFKSIFSFGSKILVAEIISMAVEDVRTLVIGKHYSTEALAFYDRGQTYPAVAMRSIYDTLSSVLLPAFAKQQSDKEKLCISIEKTVIFSLYFTIPIFIGFAAVSKQLVLILLTEKWAMSIPYLRLFCIYQLSFPIYGIMRQGLYAIGDSRRVLLLEVFKGGMFLVAILIGCQISLMGIAVSTTVAMYATTIMYIMTMYKAVRFNWKKITSQVTINILQALLMYCVIMLANRLQLTNIFQLIVNVLLGVMIYIASSIILKNSAYITCLTLTKRIRKSYSNTI